MSLFWIVWVGTSVLIRGRVDYKQEEGHVMKADSERKGDYATGYKDEGRVPEPKTAKNVALALETDSPLEFSEWVWPYQYLDLAL